MSSDSPSTKSRVLRISFVSWEARAIPSSREAIFAVTPGSLTSVRMVCGLASSTILRMVSADSSGLGSSQNSFTSFTKNGECLRGAAPVVDYFDECSSHQGRVAVLEHVSPNRYSSGSRLERVGDKLKSFGFAACFRSAGYDHRGFDALDDVPEALNISCIVRLDDVGSQLIAEPCCMADHFVTVLVLDSGSSRVRHREDW